MVKTPMSSNSGAVQRNGQCSSLIEGTDSNRVSDQPKRFRYWMLAKTLSARR